MSPSEDEAVNNGAEQEPANFEDETPTDDTKSLLLALPTELQILIVENIDLPVDLNNVSLTCKALHRLAVPRLYQDVELRLPPTTACVPILEHLIDPGANGLRYTKSLSIRCHFPANWSNNDSRSPTANPYEDYDFSYDSEGSENGVEFDITRPRPDLTVAVNCLIRMLLSRIPANSLKRFRWWHVLPIGKATLESLSHKHGQSITSLMTDSSSLYWNLSPTPWAKFPELKRLQYNDKAYPEFGLVEDRLE